MKAGKWVSYYYEVHVPDEELEGRTEAEKCEDIVRKLRKAISDVGLPSEFVVSSDRSSEIDIEYTDGRMITIP